MPSNNENRNAVGWSHMRKIVNVALIFSAVLLILAASPQIFGLLSDSINIGSSGSIKTVNISVYSDFSCTTPLSSVNWGQLSPGGQVSRTIYLKNEGTTSVTVSLGTSSWNPTAANGPITITWNSEGATIIAGQVRSATITCSVSSDISEITTFSVSIIITGTEV